MLRRLCFAWMPLALALALPMTNSPGNCVHADELQTRRYIQRALNILAYYEDVIVVQATFGNVMGVGLAYRSCAWELGTLPRYGVDPDVARFIWVSAGVLDSYGAAVMELNNPLIPPQFKALRLMELAGRMRILRSEIDRALESDYRRSTDY
ncbi:MAG: hypothetical protein RMJ19_01335 [Gemmatales bacterium]|nr:hypothetical protein [Gemmatales bacterium]MCS7159088.1 hypothetical protein [Gemmatales bacterium]MDW8174288.1 hypothetical protein [Gemmatales bacterium]MDW8221991.1 hypothetical protein [Gemmatales bacterium]